jgi:hypothetical protein
MTAMISDSSPEGLRKVRPPVQSAGEEVIAGREAEQKILRDLLRRAQRGLGGVVLVEGEPGMGKSLLLHEATQEAAGARPPWRPWPPARSSAGTRVTSARASSSSAMLHAAAQRHRRMPAMSSHC